MSSTILPVIPSSLHICLKDVYDSESALINSRSQGSFDKYLI